jgi:hypothetical protein
MIKFGSNGKEVPTIDFSNTNMSIRSSNTYAATVNDLEASVTFFIPSDDFKKMDQTDITTQLNFYLATTIGMSFLNSMSQAIIDLKQRSSQGMKPINCKFYFNNLLLAIAVGVNTTDYGMNKKFSLKDYNPDKISAEMGRIQQIINDAAIKHEELTLALYKEHLELGETISKQDLWKEKYMDQWVDYCKINLESQGIAWFKVKNLAEHQVPDLLN